MVASAASRITVELGERVARARLVGREQLGHVEVEARVEGHDVVLVPTAATVGEWRRFRLPHRMVPRVRIPIPDGLRGGHVDEVRVTDGELVLRGLVPEWREPVTPLQLEQIIRSIRSLTGSVLALPRTERQPQAR